MTMKRRSFLGFLGAAMAAPLIPSTGAAAGITRTTYGAAVAHAQKYPMVSIKGMSARVGITPKEAEAIFRRMASEGLIGRLKVSGPGRIHAPSKIFTKDAYGLVRTSQPRPHKATTQRAPEQARAERPSYPDRHANTNLMMAHLRKLCLQRGMKLSARCYNSAVYA